jgi:hypothetical protein
VRLLQRQEMKTGTARPRRDLRAAVTRRGPHLGRRGSEVESRELDLGSGVGETEYLPTLEMGGVWRLCWEKLALFTAF